MAKITEYMEIILEGNNLTFEQAKALLDIIFGGEVAEVQIAAFLAAMRVKKATVSEIAGLASSLREHAVPVKVNIPDASRLIDTCGTGGAALKTFNISTGAALVAAGAGALCGQTRKPRHHQSMRFGRRFNRAWCEHLPGPGMCGRMYRGSSYRVYVCPRVSSGHEICSTYS